MLGLDGFQLIHLAQGCFAKKPLTYYKYTLIWGRQLHSWFGHGHAQNRRHDQEEVEVADEVAQECPVEKGWGGISETDYEEAPLVVK